MRVEFVNALTPLLQSQESGVFITGDLGYNALENLQKVLGQRFINAGVAEQNMIGLAAGLALSEKYIPWVYSIAPFAVYRCFEQIRNDLCLHNLPVRLVGNGGGYTYGIMGSTHHALEDLGTLKTLPNMELFFPCGGDQVLSAVNLIHQLQGPSYLRLGISGYQNKKKSLTENKKTLTQCYHLGLSEGGKVCKTVVIGVGQAVHIALTAQEKFSEEFEETSIFGIARFPFQLSEDHELMNALKCARRLILLDEHYLSGSISESFLQELAQHAQLNPLALRVQILAARYSREQRYGGSLFHHEQSGLTPENLVKALKPEKNARVLK